MEKITQFTKKVAEKAKKTGIYAATALSTMGSYAAEDTSALDVSPHRIEVSDMSKGEDAIPAPIIYSPELSFGEDEGAKEGATSIAEGRTMNLVTHFELGSAEFGKESKEQISQEIERFLSDLEQDQVDGIRDLELAIVVRAGCSPELVESTYVTAGYTIENNADLAIARGSEISKLVESHLEKFDIAGAQIEIQTPKDGVSLSQERYAEVGLTEILREMKVSEFSNDTYGVILDKSGSMHEDVDETKREISEMNMHNDVDIEVLSLKGGSVESHLRTLEEYLGLSDSYSGSVIDKQEGVKKLYVLSDEFDETVSTVYTTASSSVYQNSRSRYLDRMSRVLVAAKDKNIEVIVRVINPNHKAGGYKEVLLAENPDALIPDEQLDSLKAKSHRLYEKLDFIEKK